MRAAILMARSSEEMVRIYGPPAYREWGYDLPCVKVGCTTSDRPPYGNGTKQCCHVRTDGVARKGNWERNTFFACWRCHVEEGSIGIDTFAQRHELAVDGHPVGTLPEAARVTYELFRVWEDGLAR